MKITKHNFSIPAVSIDNFIPSNSLVRAASESFNTINDWVKYDKVLSPLQRGPDTDMWLVKAMAYPFMGLSFSQRTAKKGEERMRELSHHQSTWTGTAAPPRARWHAPGWR